MAVVSFDRFDSELPGRRDVGHFGLLTSKSTPGASMGGVRDGDGSLPNETAITGILLPNDGLDKKAITSEWWKRRKDGIFRGIWTNPSIFFHPKQAHIVLTSSRGLLWSALKLFCKKLRFASFLVRATFPGSWKSGHFEYRWKKKYETISAPSVWKINSRYVWNHLKNRYSP